MTAELDGATGTEPTAVNVSVGRGGDSAVSGTDYQSVSGFVVTIPAGQTSGSASFTLTPTDDQIAEGPEEITVHGTASGLTVADATLTLNDDDQASSSVSLSLSPAAARENGGAARVEVTATLDGAAGAQPTTVNVSVGRSGDSAASGTDYQSVSGFVVTIPAGQTSGSASFTLTPTDDQIAEGPEEITVRGTASGLTVADATLTLNDDDSVSSSVSLSLRPASVPENGGAAAVEVTAEVDGAASSQPTAVNVRVGRSGDSAVSGTDYEAVSGFVVTIPAGRTSGSASFTLTPTDDQIAEGAEEITVHGTASGLAVADATLTLNDDDRRRRRIADSISLRLSPDSVPEDGGATRIRVTAELDGAAGTQPTAVNVSVGRSGDSAVSGTDYDAVADFVLTIPADRTSGSASFTLRPEDDGIAEGPEQITVSGTNTELNVDDATLTLQDGNSHITPLPALRVSLSPPVVPEGNGPAVVTATVETVGGRSPQEIPFVVQVGAPGDTAISGHDYEPVPGFDLKVPAGSSRGQARFVLRPMDDDGSEDDETITVVATPRQPNLNTLRTEIRLLDDDAARLSTPGTVGIRIEDATASEGARQMHFRVILDRAAAEVVWVDWGTESNGYGLGLAEAGDDYLSASGTLEIPAGQTEGSITISLQNDQEDELDERFEVVLLAASSGDIAKNRAVGTIVDDDGPTLSIRNASGPESQDSLEFVVSLSAPSLQPVTGRIVTADQTATAGLDYDRTNSAFEIAPGERRYRIQVPIIDDALDEPRETFLVRLRDVRNAGIADGDAIGAIEDDDAAPRLAGEPASAREDDGELIFEVRLSSASGREVSVSYRTADGTAHEAADYQGVSRTLTFAPGETLKRVRVGVTPDVLDEADETFTLEFRDPTHVRIETPTVTGTIRDDDAAPELAAASASARESDGELTFEVRLSSPSGREVSVRYATIDGTAHHQVDYHGVSGRLTFAPGETSKPISIALIPDMLHEADETFRLAFREPTHTTIETPVVVGTIRDDDEEPTLRIGDARASEGAGVMAFVATLDTVAGRDLRYSAWTADVEALAGEDYDGMRSELLIPAGKTAGRVEVTVLDDNVDETEETFLLTVDGGRVTGTEGRSAIGTIEDDDDNARPVQMLITRFGRGVASHLVESVEERLDDSSRGSRVSLGLDPTQTQFQTGYRNAFGASWEAMRERTGDAGLDPQSMLGRSSFLVQPEATDVAGDTVWTLWGRGANERFAGEQDGIAVEGGVLTSVVGFDYRRGGLLTGLAISRSLGSGQFSVDASASNGSARTDTARTKLTTLSPYVSVPLGSRVSLWGLGGVGFGRLSLQTDEEAVGMDMRLAAIGARGRLWAGTGSRDTRLFLKTDTFLVKTSSDANDVRPASTGIASRSRLLLEGSLRLGSLWGGGVTPTFEVGVRSDGGDAETGIGLEFGGGFRYERPNGLQVELNARSLVAHEDSAYREWGIGGTIRLESGADQRGLSLAISSSHGDALSGAQQMWNSDSPGAAGGRFMNAGGSRVEGEVGYGFGSFAGGPVIPFAGVSWQDRNGRTLRVGSRFQIGSTLLLSFDGSRRNGSQYRPDNAFVIRARLR